MSNVNIKNLPEANDINFGDYLLIENAIGTQIVKYDNFIISEKNITFQPLLSTHTSDISFNLTQIKTLTASTTTLSGYFTRVERDVSIGGDYIYTLSAIGIGHTNPDAKLTIDGNLSASGSLSAAGGGYNYLENRLGIGTMTPGAKLTIVGNSDSGDSDCRIDIIDNDSTVGSSIPAISFRSGLSTQIYQIRATDNLGLTFRDASDATKVIFDANGNVGIGTTAPSTTLHIGGSGTLGMVEATTNPLTPVAGSEAYFYLKADKFIIKFNDGGTLRYKYLVLSGDRVTWVQTLTAP
mgnify:CR=1 FL=1